MLTSRMRKTLRIVLGSDDFITLGAVAKELGVSSRTLLREVDDLQAWVVAQGGKFIKKKGKGIFVEGGTDERERLLVLLSEEKSEIVYTPTERGLIIRAELLKASEEESTKIFALTTLLGVAESTVANDLSGLDGWFEGYGIHIIRRQGLGVVLEGEESARRKAVVSLLYEYMDMAMFLAWVNGQGLYDKDKGTASYNIRKSIYGLADLDHLPEVITIINSIEQKMGYEYSDNDFMVLAIRFCVTLKRRLTWGQRMVNDTDRALVVKDRVYKTLLAVLENEQTNLFKGMPEDELAYLTIHIKGTKLRDQKDDNRVSMIEDFRIIQLTREFIMAIERETGIYLSDNEGLLYGLVKHLRPALYRMKMGLDIVNPLLTEIQNRYPKLFIATRNCVHIIETKEKITVPDDEIAYLATHIGAVIQKDDREIIKRFRVVLACMYGIGASQLLVANIEKNFRNIDIIHTASVIDYDEEQAEREQADLIISTVPIESNKLPVIVVNPLLNHEDIMKIGHFLKNYRAVDASGDSISSTQLREKLKMLNGYGEIMIQILDHFSFDKDVPAKSMNDVILYASSQIANTDDQRQKLIKAFALREEKGSTILSKKGMLLLHCRTTVVEEAIMKVIRLATGIPLEGKDHGHGCQPIETIVVMVGPLEINQIMLDVLSEISRNIITSSFSKYLLRGDDRKTYQELNRILDLYYQKLAVSNAYHKPVSTAKE